MHSQRLALLAINVVGGLAVVGSYVHGVLTNPATRGDVWGGVPDGLQPLYTVSMLTAATGYFAFSYFVFFCLDPERSRVGGFGYGLWHAIYALILLPSALWMPLTFAMLDQPSDGLWLAIRIVLAVVGLASLALVVALLRVEPRAPRGAHLLAIAGAVAFFFQTGVLDALVWPAYFPR